MNKLKTSIFAYLGLILIIIIRFTYIQLIYKDKYIYMSFQNIHLGRNIIAPRGNIYDKKNNLLSNNKNNFNLLIHTLNKKEYHNSLNLISDIIQNCKQNKRNFSHIVRKNLSWNELKYIESLKKNSLFIQQEYHRKYYYDSCANLLGHTKYSDFKHIGVSGIEKKHNNHLEGENGKQQIVLNAYGEILEKNITKNPNQGNNLHLSIDIDFQNKSYELLSTIKKGCVCVFNLEDNTITVAASYPSYDPNNIQNSWGNLFLNSDCPLINRVFEGVYPIGSIMKVFVALFALEENIINNLTQISCPGEFFIGSHKFKCWKKHGDNINLDRAITESCDVFFYSLCSKICPVKFKKFLQSLGLSDQQDAFPTKTKGFIADPIYVKKRFKRKWRKSDTLLTLIGQGMFFCTPFELNTMMSNLLLNKKNNFLFERIENQVCAKLCFENKNINMLKKYMNQVTHNFNGTSFAAWAMNYKPNIAGKTGTVQTRALKQNEYGLKHHQKSYERREHSIFCGYWPSHKPKYSITVIAENNTAAKNIAFKLCNYIQKQENL